MGILRRLYDDKIKSEAVRKKHRKKWLYKVKKKYFSPTVALKKMKAEEVRNYFARFLEIEEIEKKGYKIDWEEMVKDFNSYYRLDSLENAFDFLYSLQEKIRASREQINKG